MTFIDQTIVAIAAPTIQSELSLSREGTRWIVNAYLLALAATFALGGRIADVVDPRGGTGPGGRSVVHRRRQPRDRLEGFGVPASVAQSAADTAVNGSGTSVNQAPAAIRDQLNTAVMQDYATATRYVLYGMAVAMFLTLLAALRHPGRHAVVATDDTAAAEASIAPTRFEPSPEHDG